MKYVSIFMMEKNMPTIKIPFGKGSNSDETRNELPIGWGDLYFEVGYYCNVVMSQLEASPLYNE